LERLTSCPEPRGHFVQVGQEDDRDRVGTLLHRFLLGIR